MTRRIFKKIYYRIRVPYYEEALYNTDTRIQELANHNVNVFKDEIVTLLTKHGWTPLIASLKDNRCPEMHKDGQFLYCHPQSVSGHVSETEIDAIKEILSTASSFSLYHTDLYENIIETVSDDDERQLYAERYSDSAKDLFREAFTTPKKNLYKPESVWPVYEKNHIRTTRNDGVYSTMNPGYLWFQNQFELLKKEGFIKTGLGKNGTKLARWITPSEQKSLRS